MTISNVYDWYERNKTWYGYNKSLRRSQNLLYSLFILRIHDVSWVTGLNLSLTTNSSERFLQHFQSERIYIFLNFYFDNCSDRFQSLLGLTCDYFLTLQHSPLLVSVEMTTSTVLLNKYGFNENLQVKLTTLAEYEIWNSNRAKTFR